jgi:hypothetical protein
LWLTADIVWSLELAHTPHNGALSTERDLRMTAQRFVATA